MRNGMLQDDELFAARVFEVIESNASYGQPGFSFGRFGRRRVWRAKHVCMALDESRSVVQNALLYLLRIGVIRRVRRGAYEAAPGDAQGDQARADERRLLPG
jgi:hypothetical protein